MLYKTMAQISQRWRSNDSYSEISVYFSKFAAKRTISCFSEGGNEIKWIQLSTKLTQINPQIDPVKYSDYCSEISENKEALLISIKTFGVEQEVNF